MLIDNTNHIEDNKSIKLKEVVSIPVPLSKSMQGKYFVGQTGSLFVCDEKLAWAGLVNPCNSDVNLYANVFTISNFSDEYLTAELWLNTDFPVNANKSQKISPTNTALFPLPQNEVDIKYVKSTTILPQEGVNVYERIIPPKTTLVSEEDSKFIEPPGGNFTLIIKSSSPEVSKVIVAFGWWEKPI